MTGVAGIIGRLGSKFSQLSSLALGHSENDFIAVTWIGNVSPNSNLSRINFGADEGGHPIILKMNVPTFLTADQVLQAQTNGAILVTSRSPHFIPGPPPPEPPPPPPSGSVGAWIARMVRATQLQGYLLASGQWLTVIPSYLLSGVDLPYIPKAGYTKEIPWVDDISTARALGIYDNTANGAPWTPANPGVAGSATSSGDYVQRVGGILVYGTPLPGSTTPYIQGQIQQFLNAGYLPSDLTITVDNIPWAIAAGGGANGAYGQANPHDSDTDLTNMLVHAAQDLVNYLGITKASQVRWKFGIEDNALANYFGNAANYYDWVNTGVAAIQSVIPNAKWVPCEQSGDGHSGSQNFYVSGLVANVPGITVLPKSLNAFPANSPHTCWPTASANELSTMMAGLTQDAEVDQFGLLGLPPPYPAGNQYVDQGAVQANWQFQTIMRLFCSAYRPKRIAMWLSFDTVAGLQLTNGVGYIRHYLSQFDGWDVYNLYMIGGSATQNGNVVIGFYNPDTGDTVIMLSGFSLSGSPALETPTFPVPAGLIPHNSLSGWGIIRYSPQSTVHYKIMQDLAAANNLKSQYSGGFFTDTVKNMALNLATAQAMVTNNWVEYESIMQGLLNFQPLKPGMGAGTDNISFDGVSSMTAQIPVNELIILASSYS